MDESTVTPATAGGAWRLWWGVGPLPVGAAALGVVARRDGSRGALIRLASDRLVQGNAGAFRTLPQAATGLALAAATTRGGDLLAAASAAHEREDAAEVAAWTPEMRDTPRRSPTRSTHGGSARSVERPRGLIEPRSVERSRPWPA